MLEDIQGHTWKGLCTDGPNTIKINFNKGSHNRGWGTFDLSILNGKALQEGSTTQEYHEFLRGLETVGT